MQTAQTETGNTEPKHERTIILGGDNLTHDETVLTKLKESERRFRASMEHSPIGMALTAMDGVWIDVNPALCNFLGYSKEECIRPVSPL